MSDRKRGRDCSSGNMEDGGPEVEGGIGVRGGSGDEEEEEDGESEW